MSESSRQSLDTGVQAIRAVVRTLPLSPGVYRMLDEKGKVLYVGKAKALKKRVTNYTLPDRLPLRLQRMIARTRSMEVITTHTEAEALLLEVNLIKDLSPPYNILMKDDKSFPYICITQKHDYPRLRKHRGARKKGDVYFGPYQSANAVNSTLIALQKAFRLRSCSDSDFENRKRPCLQYHIKRCTAPCVGHVSKQDYAVQVEELRSFLSGKDNAFQKHMADKMQQASADLDFEKAAAYRDRIKALSTIQGTQNINITGVKDADFFALWREEAKSAVQVFFYRGGRNLGNAVFYPSHAQDDEDGEILQAFILQFYERYPLVAEILVNTPLPEVDLLKEVFSHKAQKQVGLRQPQRGALKRLMEMIEDNARQSFARKQAEVMSEKKAYQALADRLDLPEIPQRIEVYDNSHTGGGHAIGAMIVAGVQGFRKAAYRQFNIKDSNLSDDFDMMREVMRRRFAKGLALRDEGDGDHWPDLIVIDGGKGQLSVVMEVLTELGVADALRVLSIAKGEEREAGREKFFQPGREDFMLPPDDPALHLLQRLRDEAHRFAIGTHRRKRDKAMVKSALDDVPGIGAVKKKALLHAFGSAKMVEDAGLEDLRRVEGISDHLAQVIYDYFHASD